MVSETFSPKINLISERSGITTLQAKACDEALSQHSFLPYLKFYAQGHALGLSTLQWIKAYFFKKEYEYLLQNHADQSIEHLLQGHDKFYAYDHLFKIAPSLPTIAKDYEQEVLLNLVKQIIQQKECAPETLLAEHKIENTEQALKAMQYVFAIDLIQQAPLLHQLRQTMWEKGCFQLVARAGQNDHVKALQEQWPSPAPIIKKLDSLLFLKFWQAKKNNQVDAKFNYPENPNWLFDMLAQHIKWSPQNQAADAWIEEALKLAVDTYFYPKLHRDLLALCFDHAVEQLLPLVELQWRQLLKQKGIGAKQVLMFYPHGKSGVMVVLVNEQGELIQNFTLYPHAPDYQIENSVAEIAKILTRHPVEHIGWLVQAETKKAILKLLKQVQERYPDLHFQTHWLSTRLNPLFSRSDKKGPDLEEVVKAPQFLQDPWFFWKNCQPELFLHPLLRMLPKERLQFLWHTLLQETLLLEGIDVNQAKKHIFEIIEILSPEDIEIILKERENGPIESHTQMQTLLNKDAESYQTLAPFFQIAENLQHNSFQEEDKLIVLDILKLKRCSMEELFSNTSIMQQAMRAESLLERWGYERLYRIQNLLWHLHEHQKPIYLLSNHQAKNLSEIKLGTRFIGTIHNIVNYGCFVDLGEGVEGLLHISAIGDCYINDLNYIFQSGDIIALDWHHFDADKKRLSLSLQAEKLKYKPVMNKTIVKKEVPQKQSKAQIHKKPATAIGPSAMELAFAKLKK